MDPGYSLREFRDDDSGDWDDGLSSVQVACSGGSGLPVLLARSNRNMPPMMAAVMTNVLANSLAESFCMAPFVRFGGASRFP
jgi:hypothetical protein